MVLFANAPRLHRDAMAAAFSARGREAGVAIPQGWSVADALRQLQPAVVVYSGSHQQARQLSREVAVAHLDVEAETVLTTYVSGAMSGRHAVSSFDGIAEQLEALAGTSSDTGRTQVVQL